MKHPLPQRCLPLIGILSPTGTTNLFFSWTTPWPLISRDVSKPSLCIHIFMHDHAHLHVHPLPIMAIFVCKIHVFFLNFPNYYSLQSWHRDFGRYLGSYKSSILRYFGRSFRFHHLSLSLWGSFVEIRGTKNLPLKMGPQKERIVSQSPCFRGYVSFILLRVVWMISVRSISTRVVYLRSQSII